MARSVFTVKESTTPIYTFSLVDEDGVAVLLTDLITLTLTYYLVADSSIINSRNNQNVKNVNGVTVSATSVVTWDLTTSDTAIIDAVTTKVGDKERHRALWTWTYTTASGTKTGRDEIDILVENLGLVT